MKICIALLLLMTGLQADKIKETLTAYTAVFKIAKDDPDLKKATIKVTMWEYNPLLADASAKKFAYKESILLHKKGTETRASFALGKKDQTKTQMKYYITAEVWAKGKRLYFLDGFNKVVPGGKGEHKLKKLK